MIKQYLQASVRFLSKNWTHTAINLFGLSLGITCALMIFRIVSFEMSFDKYHSKADRIYRVVVEYKNNAEDPFSSASTYPLAPALRKDFPDPEQVILVDGNLGGVVMTIPQSDGNVKRFKEDILCFADHGFFQTFDYEWIEGNDQALNRQNSVVLTESVAKKYFGDKSAIDQVINFDNQYDLTVTGVVKDAPQNSSIRHSIIISSKVTDTDRTWTNWGSSSDGLNTFVLLREGVTKEAFESKMDGWHVKYYDAKDVEDAKQIRYFLQPISEMHYDTRFNLFYDQNPVSYTTLLTLSGVGILLLLTACVNFINLNTVLIVGRAKEVGIRKTLGGRRSAIAFQFITETFVIATIALVVSLGLAEVSLSLLTPVLGYSIGLGAFTDMTMTLMILSVPFVVALLAGVYPAIRLSLFQPLEALRSKITNTSDAGLSVRRVLVVFQLVIAQGLVIATIILVKQMQFVESKPLGLAKDAVVEFDIPERKPEMLRELVSRMRSLPGVESMTMSNSGSISQNTWNSTFETTVNGRAIKETVQVKFSDDYFLSTYKIALVTGRNLTASDTVNGVMVNEEFLTLLGLTPEEALSTPIKIWGVTTPIVGVMRNFNTTSLHEEIDPVLVMSNTHYYYNGAVRLRTDGGQETLANVQDVWEDVYSKYVFEYQFLDDTIAEFYATERRSSYLVGIFAVVAILIGCLGLYGLISFMAQNKIKEVGIRKVLGASVLQIIALFSKEFIVLIIVAFAISAPAVYYFTQEWLSNFAYKTDANLPTFLLGLAFTMIIVLVTVGVRSYSAASANPVDALRSE